jgi:2-C-methyl-D-erythritol 2,4-cyclodiphosphate synthase
MRIGHGYDVHKMAAGRKCVLCGVNVPYEYGPDGHSDADVPVHALIDAILGAAALGDIGHMFPDSDEKWKNADSIEMLKSVWHKVQGLGYVLDNCDITIIAQKPKIAAYILEMRKNIAAALSADISQVSVKATTEEGLGFTGQLQGISSHAVVLLH